MAGTARGDIGFRFSACRCTNLPARAAFFVMKPSRSRAAMRCGRNTSRRIPEDRRSGDPGAGDEESVPAPQARVLLADDFAIDRLLARGVVFGACNIPLHVQSRMLAGNASVSAEEAAKLQTGPEYHDHPIWDMRCEPHPGGGLHVLRWRLMAPKNRREPVSASASGEIAGPRR